MHIWAVKIVAAAVLTLCGMLAGHAVASSCTRRVLTIQNVRNALKQLELKMLHDMLPIGDALKATAYEPFVLVGEALEESAADVISAWNNVSKKLFVHGQLLDCLGEEDKSALNTLFQGLGLSGRAEQKMLIDRTEASLLHLEASAQERAKEVSKLHTTLGVLAGLALSIALL